MGNVQEQALGSENFGQNQALFRKYTAVDRALKNNIIAAVETVFLYPLVDHLTDFGQVSALTMIQHLLSSYGVIHEIDLEENAVNIMGTYNSAEPLA